MKSTVAVLSAWLGKPLNFTTLGRELHISSSAARKRIASLAEKGIIGLLDPIPCEQPPARKSPKLYFVRTRDSPRPSNGRQEIALSLRMITAIRREESARRPASSFYYYGGYGNKHIELIVATGMKHLGFLFLPECPESRRCWSHLKRALAKDIIQAGFVLTPGKRIFFAARCLVVMPAVEFLEHYDRWLNACLVNSSGCLQRLACRYNMAHAHLQLPSRPLIHHVPAR